MFGFFHNEKDTKMAISLASAFEHILNEYSQGTVEHIKQKFHNDFPSVSFSDQPFGTSENHFRFKYPGLHDFYFTIGESIGEEDSCMVQVDGKNEYVGFSLFSGMSGEWFAQARNHPYDPATRTAKRFVKVFEKWYGTTNMAKLAGDSA